LAKRVAVIDIGSNSIRMVVYEKTSRYAFHILHEEKSKVRLSENAYKHDGDLQADPMRRTYDALSDFVNIAQSFKVRKTLCVATSALRDAPNKKDFLKKVQDGLKLNIKVIDGLQEAYYGAMACVNLLPRLSSALSVDIGGGSTEFSLINDQEISGGVSLNIGTVRLKELFFDDNDLSGATKYVDSQLSFLDAIDVSTLVGIGGTFRAISSSVMQQSHYPLNKLHGYDYSTKVFKKTISNILKADENELIKLGVKSNRLDVIKPGALILERVLNKIKSKNIITSGVGVREGVYLGDLLRTSKDRFPHNYNASVKYILDSYVEDKTYSNQLNSLSKQLFDLTSDYLKIESKYRYELGLAAKLYPAGGSVHFYSQNKHTYYLIQSALEYGFTHQSIMLIATLTRFAKSRLPASTHLRTYKKLLPSENVTNALSFILSLSVALLSHRPRNVDFNLKFNDGELVVESVNNLYLSRDAVDKLDCDRKFKIKF
jgi:exopolyphosphatase / guanosine-5'-triphosphate,3'-diphosphate pyrophosphatase